MTTHDERVKALREELARQDQELAAVKAGIAELGDRGIEVPRALLAELEAACAVDDPPLASPEPLPYPFALRA